MPGEWWSVLTTTACQVIWWFQRGVGIARRFGAGDSAGDSGRWRAHSHQNLPAQPPKKCSGGVCLRLSSGAGAVDRGQSCY